MSHGEEMSHSPRGAKGVPQRRDSRNQILLSSWGTLKKRRHSWDKEHHGTGEPTAVMPPMLGAILSCERDV